MKQSSGNSLQQRIDVLFVGSVVPESLANDDPAFSIAGNLFQRNLLASMHSAGIGPSAVLSYKPATAFPKGRRLIVSGGASSIPGVGAIFLMAFLNISPLKQLWLGVFTFFFILTWGIRHRRSNQRVVYVYNLTVPSGLFVLLGARLIGAAAVAYLADINVPGETVPNTLYFRIDYWLHRFLIPRFDGHVVVSDKIISDFAPGMHFLRVEGGVAKETFESTAARPAPLAGGTEAEFTIVAVGKLNHANGFDILLRAFSLMEGLQYKLIIAGQGPLSDAVARAADHDSRIRYLGLVSHSEVLDLYKKADVLINMRVTAAINTRYLFPSKLMEYLASGTPVITTRTNHIEEYAPFLYLLDDETPAGLAKTIRYVASLSTEQRLAAGRDARKYIQLNKMWDIQGVKFVRYLQEVLMRRR